MYQSNNLYTTEYNNASFSNLNEKFCIKVEYYFYLNFLFHRSTVSVDWSNTFMNVGANKI